MPTIDDLPAPLRPTRAWHSCAATSKLTSLSAIVGPNRLLMLTAAWMGGRSCTGGGRSGSPSSDATGRLIERRLLELIAPEVLVVDIFLRDQRRRQFVF